MTQNLHRMWLLFPALALGGCSLGPSELLIILAIVVLLFGATRLPQLGKALGDTIKSFRESSSDGDKSLPDRSGGKDVVRIEEAKVERDELPAERVKRQEAAVEEAKVEREEAAAEPEEKRS